MIKEYKRVFFNYCNVKDSLKWSRNFYHALLYPLLNNSTAQFYCTIYALTAAHTLRTLTLH